MRARRRLSALSRMLVVACVLPVLVASETSTATAATAAPGKDVQVGTLTLRPCQVVARALCGSIRRDWDPDDPAAGRVRVGFAFVRAREGPAVGTLVPHEVARDMPRLRPGRRTSGCTAT